MAETVRTPLYEEHVRLGARLVPFAGWEMPLLYRGIIPEHLYTREKASIFDICHMGEFEISGPSAAADLEKLLTQSVALIPKGGCAYGYLLAEDGGVLDDLICYRFSGEKFWLVVNAGTTASDAQWIKDHLSRQTVFRDLSSETAKLDIQGPLAREEIEKALNIKLPDLAYYHFQPLKFTSRNLNLGRAGQPWSPAAPPLAGKPVPPRSSVGQGCPTPPKLMDVDCVLSRTGYTGEFGYELYLPVQQAVAFWKQLLAPGNILPAGLGARDTLRVEMGYPLYGHELSRKRTPAGAGRGKFIDVKKPFIGREAVLRELENPSGRMLAGLRLEGRMAGRPGDEILDGEHNVGEVTSGLFAPSLNVAVALGYVERQFASIGRKLSIRSRGKILPAEVIKLPFYKQGTARC